MTGRRTWLTVASVAVAFSFIVLAVMLGLYLSPLGDDPFDSAEWRGLKAELAQNPKDPVIGDRVRTLDLDLRREFFRQRERTKTGATLLLTGLVIALVAIKRANRRSMPEPDEPAEPPSGVERDRATSRLSLAVGVTGALFAAGAVLLWLTAPSGFGLSGGGAAAAGVEAPTWAPPSSEEMAQQWPAFRGHDGSGVAPPGDVPLTWDGPAGKNILWKTRLPLPGTNSPVVWENRVFLTGANREREEVYCIDADSGAMLWKKGLVVVGRRAEPPDPMEDTGYAAPTAATDGRHVYVMFTSGRVAALDFDGTQVWIRSFGPFENTYGHSSSLAYFEGRVLLQLDQAYQADEKSKLVALDGKTGKTVWERPRPVDSSWASPIVCRTPSGPQVVLSATPIAAAYDPKTGERLWEANVVYGEVAPTPIHRDGTVFLAQEDVGTFAIATDGRGDVTETHVVWNVPAGAPDVTSPVCDGERVYVLTTSGLLTAIRADDGEVVWERELEDQFYASPAIAGNAMFLTSWDGVTTVLEVGDEYREIGKNPLGEGVFASFAFGGGRIFVRGKDHLFAIGGAR